MTWESKFEEKPLRTSFTWIIAVVVFLLILGWVLAAVTLGLRTATAGIVGRAETHIQNQSSNNRVVQQAGFETAYADFNGYIEKLKDATAAITEWDKANAGKTDNAIGTLATQRQYLVQVRDGLRQQCQNTVATYNADTHKTLSKDWKRSDLPYELDPSTSCR